jgi:hypothetical protein
MRSSFIVSTLHVQRPRLAAVRMALVLLGLAQVLPAAAFYGTTTSGTLAFDRSSTFSLTLNTFNPAMGCVNQVGGIEFSLPAGTYQLDWMTLALRSAINTAQMTFTLYSGNTQPQTALATTTLNLPFTGSTYNLYNVSFPATVTLLGLQNYFLIGSLPQSTSANSQIDWAGSSPGSPTPDLFGQTWLTGPMPHTVLWDGSALAVARTCVATCG